MNGQDPKDDLLSHAVRALRDEGQRAAPQARLTRERILAELRPARRSRRWVWTIPIAALLAGSTVLAATGRLPEILSNAARVLGLSEPGAASSRPDASRPRRSPSRPVPSQSSPPALDTEPAAPEPEVPTASSEAPPVAASSPVAPEVAPSVEGLPPGLRKAGSVPSARPAASVATPAPSAPEPAAPVAVPSPSGVGSAPPEGPDSLALYRTAHRLHFVDQNPAAALAAWDAYLATDPHGPLAVDARYDRGLCLLRLGRKDDARRALEPFAAGKYGGYRQSEAKALLDAVAAP